MRISTKLRLSVYIPAIMALVIIVALVFSYREMTRIQENGDIVRQIRSSITELNHFVFSYTLYHEERPKQQLLTEYEKLTGLIASAQLSNPEQQRLLDSIRQNNEAMESLFLQLVSIYEGGDAAGAEDRLVGLLLLRSYEADASAALLRDLIDDGIRTAEIWTTGLILLVIVLATVPLTVVLRGTRRGITTSLSSLSEGVAVIGSGNLDFRIEEKGSDEVTDLSRAFNRMTASLKDVTASKAELEREIEERKKAEERLRESERRLAEAQYTTHIGSWEWDLTTGEMQWSDEMYRIIGVTPHDFTPTMEIAMGRIHPDERQKAREHLDEALARGTGSYEHRVVLPDGSTRDVFAISVVTYDAAGKPKRLSGTLQDITERKKADRMKDEFIGMVSHELRTPLTVMMGALHTATAEGVSEKDAQELIQEAIRSTNTLASIVENLLELSRSQADRLILHTELADIGRIARDVVRKLQSGSAIHRLNVDLPEGLPHVQVDAVRIERILFNLVENAIKYSTNGGEVRVSALRQDNNLIIGVSDQGPGISPENQKRLFQSFEQLGIDNRRATQGVGLGLRVCRTLVEAHHGEIWVESEFGKGSTFCFTLPIEDNSTDG